MAKETTELRGMCPSDTVAILDAVSIARSINRIDLVNEVLGKFAEKTLHEANIVMRVTRGNPELLEALGKHSEKLAKEGQ